MLRTKKLFLFGPNYAKKYLGKFILPYTNKVANYVFPNFFLNEATFLLTYNCNLRCIMCPQWGELGVCKENKKKELTLKEWQKIILELNNAGIRNFFLTGGEPLLYKNWDKIAQKLKTKKATLSLITNGLLLEENTDKIINYIDNLHLSLYLFPQKNNEQKINKIISGINKIIKLKIQKNKNTPYLNLVFTLNSQNQNNLYSLITYYSKKILNFDRIIIQHLLFLKKSDLLKQKKFLKKYFCKEIWALKGFLLNNKEINLNVLSNEIKKLKEDKKIKGKIIFKPNLQTLKDLKDYYSGIVPKKYKNKTCFAPWWQIIILPEGTLWLCPDIALGNLTKTNFKTLMQSESVNKLKNIILEKKILPTCRGCCYLYE